jgi:hypothetical protein
MTLTDTLTRVPAQRIRLERIRLDRESEASHDLNRLLDKPERR